MSEHSILDTKSLHWARKVIGITTESNSDPSFVTALRCIDRMIPRRVHEEYDTRLFQSRHNDGWREYQCPECKCALDDCVPEDEVISDVIFYCPFRGQALEWDG